MSTIDFIVSFVCEAKPKNVEGTHRTPSWLGRVPVEDVPAVMRFLKNQGTKARIVYRDKSGQNRYARDKYRNRWVSGWAHKQDATHADIYEQPPGEISSQHRVGGYDMMMKAAQDREIKSALNGKKTSNPRVLSALAENPAQAYTYATKALKARWPEAEEKIAKSSLKDLYLQRFPEARTEWTMNGWLDWLDL